VFFTSKKYAVKNIKEMKIFKVLKGDEGCYKINEALTVRRLELRAFSGY
jgi:hypothetical protein